MKARSHRGFARRWIGCVALGCLVPASNVFAQAAPQGPGPAAGSQPILIPSTSGATAPGIQGPVPGSPSLSKPLFSPTTFDSGDVPPLAGEVRKPVLTGSGVTMTPYSVFDAAGSVPGPVPALDELPSALTAVDSALNVTGEAPELPVPGAIESPFAPELGAPLDTPVFESPSIERRAFGVLSAPKFISGRRGFSVAGNRVRYGAAVSATVAYNDNVFGTSSGLKGDVFTSLQPVFFLGVGTKNSVQFLWAPSVLKFSKYKQFDAVDQNFLVSSRYRMTKLTLGLDASYVTQSGLFLNSQGQAQQSTLFARVFASYPVGTKTDLLLAVEGSSIDSGAGGSQFQGSFSASVDYRYSRKTTLGAGWNVGYNTSDVGRTTYQTFLLRLLYNPTAKITFRGEGGIQFRQSSSDLGGSSSSSSVIVSALLSYQATAKTTVSGRFFRTVDVDTFDASTLLTVNGFEANLGWQMSRRFLLEGSLLAGYAEQTTLAGEEDDSYIFAQGTVSLSYLLLEDVNVRAFYSFQQRLRDTQSNNFLSSTTGMSLGARF